MVYIIWGILVDFYIQFFSLFLFFEDFPQQLFHLLFRFCFKLLKFLLYMYDEAKPSEGLKKRLLTA